MFSILRFVELAILLSGEGFREWYGHNYRCCRKRFQFNNNFYCYFRDKCKSLNLIYNFSIKINLQKFFNNIDSQKLFTNINFKFFFVILIFNIKIEKFFTIDFVNVNKIFIIIYFDVNIFIKINIDYEYRN